MLRSFTVLVAGITSILVSRGILAQSPRCPAEWMNTFGASGLNGSGVGGSVEAITVLPNGNLIVGGGLSVGRVSGCLHIAQLNSDTGGAYGLGVGVEGSVYALATLPDGQVLVGGDFPYVNGPHGVYTQNVARYMPATGEWSSFFGGVGVVRSLLVTPSGSVFVGGQSVIYYSSATSLATELGNVAGGTIRAFCALPNGDVVVGGSYSSGGGTSAHNIARVNTTTGVWTALGAGTDGEVDALALLPDGTVAVGGTFSSAGGATVNGIARVDPGTGNWSPFTTGVQGPSASVKSLLISGNRLLAGGRFDTAGGAVAHNLASFNLGTSAWESIPQGPDGAVNVLAKIDEHAVAVGGSFSTAGGSGRAGIARYRPETGEWADAAYAVYGQANAMAALSGTKIVVGGAFSMAGRVPARNIATFDTISGTWTEVGGGTNGTVSSVIITPNGDVVASGQFTLAGATSVAKIARYDVMSSQWMALGAGPGGYIQSLAPLSNGDIVAVGSFPASEGAANYCASIYTAAANQWTPIGDVGENQQASCVAVLADGDIAVGGGFSQIDGVPADMVARYHRQTGTWSSLGGLPFASVYPWSLAVTRTGGLVMGSYFGNVAEYNFASSSWSPLPAVGLPVWTLAVLDDNTLVAGGPLMFGPDYVNGCWSLNTQTNTWVPLGGGTSGGVQCLLTFRGQDVIVGGNMEAVGGASVSGIARYTFGQPAPAISIQPVGDIACPSGEATYSVHLTGTQQVSLQWQWMQASETAGQWQDIAEGTNNDNGGTERFSAMGSHLSTLTVTPPVVGEPFTRINESTPIQFRCAVTNENCTVNSDAAPLSFGRYADVGTQGAVPGHDGHYDNNDFIIFIAYFFSQHPLGDCGTSGGLPGVDGRYDNNDFIVFINMFFDGC